MIRYSLKCAEGHGFESWFQSADAFEALAARGMLSCVICGGTDVKKAVMAPRVAVRDQAPAPKPADKKELSGPASPAEQALKAFRAHLEKTSTYVGGKFAEEARKIHLGDAPERTIHGEASGAEARALIDDGVPIAPLPFVPKSKSN